MRRVDETTANNTSWQPPTVPMNLQQSPLFQAMDVPRAELRAAPMLEFRAAPQPPPTTRAEAIARVIPHSPEVMRPALQRYVANLERQQMPRGKPIAEMPEFRAAPQPNVWLVHGTFQGGNDSNWSAEFQNYVGDLFNNETVREFGWSGNLSIQARNRAARELADDVIRRHRQDPDSPIRLVGFSHGGNVNILAANILAEKGIFVDSIITIGTPVRSDHQLTNPDMVGRHINVFNENDVVQILGGRFTPNPFRGHLIHADRVFDEMGNVRNVEVAPARIFGPRYNHNFMLSNPEVWRNYIEYYLRRYGKID